MCIIMETLNCNRYEDAGDWLVALIDPQEAFSVCINQSIVLYFLPPCVPESRDPSTKHVSHYHLMCASAVAADQFHVRCCLLPACR
jgi:hypothetical protein